MKNHFLTIILACLCVFSSCEKENRDFSINKVWFKAKAYNGNQVFYLNFNDNGKVFLHCEASSSLYARTTYFSNNGTYKLDGNVVFFDLKTSNLIDLSSAHVITTDDDISHVTYGVVARFVSGIWEDSTPTSYLECFSRKLRVKYETADIIAGKIYEDNWEEHEIVFQGTHDKDQ